MKQVLEISAELENVDKLCRQPGNDYNFKVKCMNCGSVTDNWISVNSGNEVDMPAGRGVANLVIKCKFCSRENSVDVVSEGDADTQSLSTGETDFATIAEFECRGVELVEFQPRDGFCCVGEDSGTPFADVDLSDEYADYDDRAGNEVGVYSVKSRFRVVKDAKRGKKGKGKK